MDLKPNLFSFAGRAAAVAAVAGAVSFAAPAAFAGPFQCLQGTYSGFGYITPNNGQRERVRCRVTNHASGNSMRQSMVCASTAYKINASSRLRLSGSSVSGSWSEANYHVSGNASGRATSCGFDVRINSNKFKGSLSMSGSGNQNIALSGSGFSVTVSLNKR